MLQHVEHEVRLGRARLGSTLNVKRIQRFGGELETPSNNTQGEPQPRHRSQPVRAMELHNASQSQATHSTPTINITGTTLEIPTTETNAAGDELAGAESDVTAETAALLPFVLCGLMSQEQMEEELYEKSVSISVEELDEATELGALVHRIFSRAALVG